MKKFNLKAFSIIISMLMIMFVSFSASAANGAELTNGWVNLSDTDSEAPTQTDVSAIRGPGLMLDFNLPGFTFQSVTHDGKKFDQIVFPDQSSLGDDYLGAPNVPMMRHIIGIIEGAELSVTITDVDYVEFSDINIEPLQESLLETETLADREFQLNKDIYTTDSFFPENWAIANAVGKYHGVALGEIELFPVRFNPVKKTVQVAKSLSLTVEFLGERATNSPGNISPHLTNSFKSMLLNFDLMQYPLRRSSYGNDGVDYLILADKKFVTSPSLIQFAEHYRSKGMNVEIKDVSTIGKQPSQIKNYIKSIYGNGSNPELDYVLFAAHVDAIKFGRAKDPKSNTKFNSDIWYARLDGNDYFADVGLGRFPAKNEEQMKWMVDKSINFNNNVVPGVWRDRSLLIAHGQEYPKKYTKCIRDIKENHQKNVEMLLIEGGDRIGFKEGSKPRPWKNEDVVSKINDGYVIVNYRGHGSKTAWIHWNKAKKDFDVRVAGTINNGNKTPIVFSIACTNTAFNPHQKTISEAFVVQKQGAVAYLGATEPSYTTTNHVFDNALYNAAFSKKIASIGDIFNDATVETYKVKKLDKNVTLYLWVGDPALSLVPQSNNKVTLTVNIQGNGTVTPSGGSFDKGTTITLNARPGSGASFVRWGGDLSGSGNSVNLTMNTNKTVTAEFTDNSNPGGNIATDDFETYGWKGGEGAWVGAWKKTGNVRKNSKKPFKGKKYARLLTSNAKLERSVDLSRAKNPKLRFASRIRGFEADDRVVVKVSSNGVNYTEVMVFTIDHSDNVYHTYEIPLSNFPKTNRFQILFESQMKKKKDYWYLDNIEIVDN